MFDRKENLRKRGAVGRQNKRAATIAEAAASMVVMVPLMVLLIFTALEVSYACFLLQNLAQAARTAARSLAVEYGADPDIVGDRNLQDQLVFDFIRLPNVVNDSAQFDTPYFQTANQPHTVTVTVHYTGGQYSLPLFPTPDPLRLGLQFPLTAQSTYRLE